MCEKKTGRELKKKGKIMPTPIGNVCREGKMLGS